jgi:hypothetical protein
LGLKDQSHKGRHGPKIIDSLEKRISLIPRKTQKDQAPLGFRGGIPPHESHGMSRKQQKTINIDQYGQKNTIYGNKVRGFLISWP